MTAVGDARKRLSEAENAVSRPASPQPTNSPSDALAGSQGVEAIRARLRRAVAVATEGPWFSSCGGLYVYGATPGDEVARFKRRTDSDFALAARELIPELLVAFDETLARATTAESVVASVRELADAYQRDVDNEQIDGDGAIVLGAVADDLKRLTTPTTTETEDES